MVWHQISLDVPDDLKDAVVGELSELGAAGVWESVAPGSGYTRLTSYFRQSTDPLEIRESIGLIFSRAGHPPPPITESSLPDHDWTEEWKKSYTSFPIGRGFFVIPSWNRSACPAGRTAIHIDPGQAFGTGTHETTQLTLEALERWLQPHQTIVDLGTGSGILAIAASMLGASRIFACDNDPVATSVADENIQRNSAGGVQTVCGSIDAFRSGSIDLLLANLTADTITQIFPEIQRAVKDGGLIIFSGILTTQREQILQRIKESGHAVFEEHTRGEWLALVIQKHGD